VTNHKHVTLSSRIRRDQSGEGVISTAIAVLIMAFIGAAMWIAFNNVFTSASETIESEVGNIGNSGS
jgi:Flp pilus assembly protein TadG